ncbi:hypothetical protein ACWGNE_08075 [Streptomyces xiamenensis]
MSDTSPAVFVNHFLVAKDGSSASECEDAVHIRPETIPDESVANPLCVAVSDGASESLLAGRWSRLLVEHAAEVGALHPETFGDARTFSDELVRRAVAPWADQIAEYSERRAAAGRPVQWYERPGLDKGAFATLAAVRLAPSSGAPAWEWQAVALGDSCLFHVGGDTLRTSFPLTSSAGFGLNPQLLGSRNNDVELIADRLSYAHGLLPHGEQLLLATDALAAWFLRGCEEESQPWREIDEVVHQGHEEFTHWVGEQRARKLMRNDDVALVRIAARTERSP